MHYYQVYNLKITSDIPVRPLANVSGGFDACDIRIRLRKTPDALSQKSLFSDLCVTVAENEFLFFNEKLGVRIYARQGREIIVDQSRYRDPDFVSLYLLGNILGAVWYMRGIIPLRASAVMTEHGAVLILGASGVGKSTLACGLVRRGYPLIADAIVPVEIRNDVACVLPGCSWLKLWRDSLLYNQLPAKAHSRIRKPLNKYYVEVPDAVTGDAVPIRKIYHVAVHNAGELQLSEQADSEKKLKVLEGNIYHSSYATGLNREREALRAVALLAGYPMTAIARPQRPKDFEDDVQRLERDINT